MITTEQLDQHIATATPAADRIAALERRVQELEDWLQEVADDMLDRTNIRCAS